MSSYRIRTRQVPLLCPKKSALEAYQDTGHFTKSIVEECR